MKKIGILGGTFNPPHNGHLIIANEVLSKLDLDNIWFMPNQEPPHKKKEGKIADDQRLQMLQLAIEDHPFFQVEPIELERQGPSFTFETMKILTERHRDIAFHFIIGADMVEYLPNWHKIDELLKLMKFVGVNRPTYSNKTDYPILNVETPSLDLSSSMIRQRIKEGRSVRYLIPESVRTYIKENRLYGS